MPNPIKDLYIKIWKFREGAEPYWPTPDPQDSLRFAFCEAGEALDARLRMNPVYQRNNDPFSAGEEDILNELADTAIMLLTAIGPDHPVYTMNGVPENLDVDTLCLWVGNAWSSSRKRMIEPTRWKNECLSIVTGISKYKNMDLPIRVAARLERIKLNHLIRTKDPEDDL